MCEELSCTDRPKGIVVQHKVWLKTYVSLVDASSCSPGCGEPHRSIDSNENDTDSSSSDHQEQQLHTTAPRTGFDRVAKRKSLQAVSKPDQITHIWKGAWGYFGYDLHGNVHQLTRKFLNHEFEPWFINHVRASNKRKFAIPEGSSDIQKKHHMVVRVEDDAPHPIVLQQLHCDSCVISSAASAFLVVLMQFSASP